MNRKVSMVLAGLMVAVASVGASAHPRRELPRPRITVAEHRAVQMCVSDAYGTAPVAVDGRLQQPMDEATFRSRVAETLSCRSADMDRVMELYRNTVIAGGGGTSYASASLPALPAMPALPNFSAPPPATPSDAGTTTPAPTTPAVTTDAAVPAEDAAVDVAVTPVTTTTTGTTTTTTTSVVAPVIVPSADGSTGSLIPESRVFVLPAIPPDAGTTAPARTSRSGRRASR